MNRRSEGLLQAVCMGCLIVLMIVSRNAIAQNPPEQPTFKPEEIEALVAPIALYPDSVLSQVLMASTYPLEIVYAARWVKANPNVKGDAAVKAVEGQSWDVSVKSLVAFPQILAPMNDKLDWTQKLGDAFLAQEKGVLAAVQRLRSRAQQSGNLKSNDQQNVTVEPAPAGAQTTQTIVRIEPANPAVIYVPAYNPAVVYGAWSYPAYPPYYWPPSPAYYPGAALATGLAWGVGLAAAGAIFGNCNWGGGDVNINVNKAANIDRNFDRSKAQNGKWQHDAGHRQGVAYRDNASREKFANNVSGADRRGDYRGRDNQAGDRGGRGNNGGIGDNGRGNNGGIGDNGRGNNNGISDNGRGNNKDVGGRNNGVNNGGVADRSSRGNSSGVADRSTGGNAAGAGGRDNAFQGVGNGARSQQDFNRGRSSAQSSNFNRSGGGGMRSGGGGARGRR